MLPVFTCKYKYIYIYWAAIFLTANNNNNNFNNISIYITGWDKLWVKCAALSTCKPNQTKKNVLFVPKFAHLYHHNFCH